MVQDSIQQLRHCLCLVCFHCPPVAKAQRRLPCGATGRIVEVCQIAQEG